MLGRALELLGIDRPRQERVHRDRRDAGLVDRRDADRAACGGRQADPPRGRAACVEAHARPGEGKPRPARLVGEERRVKRRVKERRVGAEAGDLPRLLLAQRNLGEELLAAPPGGPKPLEGGPVAEAHLGQTVVEVFDLERLGARGRPGLGGERRRRRVGAG